MALPGARELTPALRARPRHTATVCPARHRLGNDYVRRMPDVSFKDLCIDVTARDGRAAAVANFWAKALGQPVVTHDDGDLHLGPPSGGSKARVIWINSVPEAIAGKSRVHIDVRVAGGDPSPLVEAGGTIERMPDDDIGWHIVNDPEGNEFCVFE